MLPISTRLMGMIGSAYAEHMADTILQVVDKEIETVYRHGTPNDTLDTLIRIRAEIVAQRDLAEKGWF